ncbi:SMP-30/gluconolactonase/LRE family protein [Piscinibacter sakaiensis]|uniref:Gluconolactonase n=1 Tax=Piscinibacter sakaiensis TaxID=1547922 RepID=A0A0K8P096_PISS1|nr:SMP-30/gluconolactonase/LRE family protein [Piscinibacter sakaiensis]GAP36056.1 gluconolactonase [Piscinibacter sakaiensis]
MRLPDEPAEPDDPVSLAVAITCRLGESPVWHPQEQALYWCDIPAGCVYRHDPRRGSLDHWTFDTDVGCLAPTLDGRLLLAMRDGLWRFDPRSGERERLARAPYDPALERFNDGKCDPRGAFWVGTIYEPREPARARLYRYRQGRLDPQAGGVVTANGLAWSPDGRRMYWSDTKAHRIDVFDVDPVGGDISGRRPFVQFPARDPAAPPEAYGGRPDGAAVDSEGAYWCAMYEGARLLRIAPDGTLLREVRLPVQCPTMPCFGGPDLRTLYVTTASDKRPPEERARQPWAGGVLSLRVDVPGLPAHLFLA